MAGYTRQSVYDNGDLADADLTNSEFNALVSAFSQSGGHTHNASDEGGYVPLISDTTNTNKVEVTASGARTTGSHEVTGNIVVGGTVDGRDVATDGTKLDSIDSGATDDMTGAEIKAVYELEPNAFTDAQFTKLSGIETGATADQTGAEIKSAYESEPNAFTDTLFTKLSGIETGATADQTGAEIKALYEAEANAFTDSQFTKLSGIETGATADQTGAEIKIAYESEADTNAFTDAEQTKLSGIETNAKDDQSASEVPFTPSGAITATNVQDAIVQASGTMTDAEVKTAYENNPDTNAFTDAEQTKLSGIETGATADQVASDVPFTPFGTISATDVQAAIQEVAQEAGTSLTDAQIKTAYENNANTNAYTDAEKIKLDTVETNAAADQIASDVPFTAAGNILSTDVQNAIEELDTEKIGVRYSTSSAFNSYSLNTSSSTVTTSVLINTDNNLSHILNVSQDFSVTLTTVSLFSETVTVKIIMNVTGTPTITWPSSVQWASGTAPDTVAGKMVFVLSTSDGGTTWEGVLVGSEFS